VPSFASFLKPFEIKEILDYEQTFHKKEQVNLNLSIII